MATLPSRKPHCPFCKSENLKPKKVIVGEGIYRRIQNQVICLDCEEVAWVEKP